MDGIFSPVMNRWRTKEERAAMKKKFSFGRPAGSVFSKGPSDEDFKRVAEMVRKGKGEGKEEVTGAEGVGGKD